MGKSEIFFCQLVEPTDEGLSVTAGALGSPAVDGAVPSHAVRLDLGAEAAAALLSATAAVTAGAEDVRYRPELKTEREQ